MSASQQHSGVVGLGAPPLGGLGGGGAQPHLPAHFADGQQQAGVMQTPQPHERMHAAGQHALHGGSQQQRQQHADVLSALHALAQQAQQQQAHAHAAHAAQQPAHLPQHSGSQAHAQRDFLLKAHGLLEGAAAHMDPSAAAAAVAAMVAAQASAAQLQHHQHHHHHLHRHNGLGGGQPGGGDAGYAPVHRSASAAAFGYGGHAPGSGAPQPSGMLCGGGSGSSGSSVGGVGGLHGRLDDYCAPDFSAALHGCAPQQQQPPAAHGLHHQPLGLEQRCGSLSLGSSPPAHSRHPDSSALASREAPAGRCALPFGGSQMGGVPDGASGFGGGAGISPWSCAFCFAPTTSGAPASAAPASSSPLLFDSGGLMPRASSALQLGSGSGAFSLAYEDDMARRVEGLLTPALPLAPAAAAAGGGGGRGGVYTHFARS